MLQIFSSLLFSSLLSSFLLANTGHPEIRKCSSSVQLDDRTFTVKECLDKADPIINYFIKEKRYYVTRQNKDKQKNQKQRQEQEREITLSEGEIALYVLNSAILDLERIKISGPVREGTRIPKHIYGVRVEQEGAVISGKGTLKDLTVGLNAESNSLIYLGSGSIEDSEVAVYSRGDWAYISLDGVSIKVGHKGVGLLNKDNASIMMGREEGKGDITFTSGNAVYIDTGEIILDNIAISNVKGSDDINHQHAVFSSTVQTAFHIRPGSVLTMEKGDVTLEYAHGLVFDVEEPKETVKSSEEALKPIEVDIDGTNIQVNSDQFYGMYLHHLDKDKKSEPSKSIVVSLKKANFTVPKSTVIYSDKSDNNHDLSLKLSENTTVSGDLLLQANSGVLKIEADHSKLEGGALITNRAIVDLHLNNGSTWTLTRRAQQQQRLNGLSAIDSSISTMLLSDSSVIFKKPISNVYQTLRIGKGSGTVYTAKGNAQLYINTYLNQGGEIANQKTDRVLIDGDVSGTTTVHVLAVSGSGGDEMDRVGNNKGISIIQVSGTAEQDSFKLSNNYMTLDNLPYQYRLYAYGPGSDLGPADPRQRLVGTNGEEGNRGNKSNKGFWDYRLQVEYIDPLEPQRSEKPDLPKKRVLAVVPQLPSYLVLPHALFHTDFVDMNNQYELLEARRNGINETGSSEEANFFIHGYGGHHRYASNLTVFEYGYNADLDYNAMMAGVVKTLESKHSALSLGAIGTYSRLSLQPYAVEQSQKSVFDKWSGKFYAHLQRDTGFYMNGLISFSSFKGIVSTLARGKTATLKGDLLSSSLMGGQAIVTNYDGFVIEPQIQVIYQSVMFDKARDIDRFDIDLGNHNQWIARVGSRFIKVMTGSEEERIVSFYSKFHFAHSYENKQIVHFKNAFQLGAFGSTVEAGLGIHAQLLSEIVFHGDLLYKHKLTKAGFSGTSISGGIRYQF
ncbi:autotransporter outer membrane beta-barrel domain-containing protein [Bartonella sp. JB15]|uniref:autotransporter outer membrane beta-barrel domain-containing protein n=1 Tax=Bartonella sp. JB15 TaxID=1933906 RepID=UPI000999B6A1|nr:autotransporter outer membrane beta-barrel domain-containing protein [Bartonella sp. JB15]AQX28239.1 outer membrane autotransporter barrel domain-containing protein [Bartonella sp. JB15]